MLSSLASSCKFQVFMNFKKELEMALVEADVGKLSLQLHESKVVSKEVKDKLISLDHSHLDPDRRVRYITQQMCETMRCDSKVYDRLVRVLSKLGGRTEDVCESMRKDLDKIESGKATGVGNIYLTEKDVPDLVELIVSGSHKWEEIGIAIGLPEYKRDECRNGNRSNPSKLTKILTAWLLGGCKGTKTTTLDSLKAALASEIVGLPSLAQNLRQFKHHCDATSEFEVSSSEFIPEIVHQSSDTDVTDGKSTLLEVQFSFNGHETYQWSKNNIDLQDGPAFSGVFRNMLYINRATQGTEGKYVCWISNGSETICSDEINVRVIYPPEKEYLVRLYLLKKNEVPKDSWPPVGIGIFVNLVLIKQEPISKLNYSTMQGDVDDILESKEVTQYEEVFKDYEEGALVLIEGRPGSGKTTLVHKIARDWATGNKILHGASKVFLISLRFINYSGRDRKLVDILFYDDENLSQKVEGNLKKCGGKGACFIIDGLDEYQPKCQGESVIYHLIYKKCLPFSMVIVASRPVATSGIRDYSTKRIEVLGFTRQQIYEYVGNYPFEVSKPTDMARRLKLFLSQHGNILHMCYLPVHAAIICFLFSQLEGDIPHTETQIYEQFAMSTILRQKTRNKGSFQLKSLKSLCGQDKIEFSKIVKLAYEMIINSQQVVSQSVAKVSLSNGTDSDLACLGLLTVERTYRHYGNEDMYTFLHLTFQEYLAAFYLAEMEVEKQIEVITEHASEPRLKNIWKFFCGLVVFSEQSTVLSKMLSCLRETRVDDFSVVQCAYESQQVQVCDGVVSEGTLLIKKKIVTASDFVALAYVISTASCIVSRLILRGCIFDKDGVLAFSSEVDMDKLCFLKCFKLFNTIWKSYENENFETINALLGLLPFLEELDLLNITLSKSNIEYLTHNVSLPHMKILKISLPLESWSQPEEVLRLLAFNSRVIEEIHFCAFINYGNSMSLDNVALWKMCLCHAFGFEIFLEGDISWIHLSNPESFTSLDLARLTCCSEVFLANCGIDDEGVEILANRLNVSVMENLVLDFNKISDLGAIALAGCITKCSVVREVSIQCNSIGDSGTRALANALCNSLRSLNLQGNALGDEGAVVLAKAAGILPKLTLYLYNLNITEDGVKRILENKPNTKIRTMTFGRSWEAIESAGIETQKIALNCGTLPALQVSTDNFDQLFRELKYIRNIRGLRGPFNDYYMPTMCNIIKSMSNLKELDLSIGLLNATTAQALSNSLNVCKSLCNLHLHGNRPPLHNCVLDGLKSCSNLKSLGLSNCHIGSVGIEFLFSDYKTWVNIEALYLDGNEIDPCGVQVLRKLFINCKRLRCLDLSSNMIGSNGLLDLAEGLDEFNSLEELKVGSNDISSGMIALAKTLHHNPLQHLDLSQCNIGLEFPYFFLTDDINGSALQTLDLSGNYIGFAVSLSFNLKTFKHLTELNVSSSGICSVGMSYLASGLKYCTNLQVLNLGFNDITCASGIVTVMESCSNLHYICLFGNYIGIDGAIALVSGWKHKNLLSVILTLSIEACHNSALIKGNGCCSKCDNLLELYSSNDYIYIELDVNFMMPKVICSGRVQI